jgi:hypothetical protein
MRSTCRSKGEKSCVWILFAACMVIAAVLAAPVAQAGATTITLVLSAGGVATSSVSSGTVVTLTATVTNPAAVTAGTVNFCNATATECLNQTLIGTAQLTAAGTAVIRLLPGIGSRSYKAVFVATTTNATSTSTAQPLTVTGLYPTSTTISSSGSPGNYTLTGTVVGTGSYSLSPTGSVSFLDTTNSNYLVGSASLGSSTITPSFPNVTYSAGGTPTGLAVADFNNDGIPDVAVPNCSGNSMSILLGTSTGTLGAPLTPANATGNCPLFTAVGDFDADGNLDLAVVNVTSGTVSVFFGNGDGTFQPAVSVTVGSVPTFVVVADFNRDGILDLAVANDISDTVGVLLGNGNRTTPFQAQVPYPTGAGTHPLALAVGDGTALSSTQLDAKVAGSLPGTFVYSPAAATIPAAGIDKLSVTFTPNDATDYTTATASATLTVESFTVSLSGAPSQTVTVAGTTTVDFKLSPVGSTTLPGVVTFSVTGLPANTTYSLTPAQVPAGSPVTTVSLVIQTGNSQSAWNTEPPGYQPRDADPIRVPVPIWAAQPSATHPKRQGPFPFLPLSFGLAAGGAFCGFRRFKGHRLTFSMLALAAITMVLGGCGAGVASSSSTTAPGSYAITVTATSGTQHDSASFTLVVQ